MAFVHLIVSKLSSMGGANLALDWTGSADIKDTFTNQES